MNPKRWQQIKELFRATQVSEASGSAEKLGRHSGSLPESCEPSNDTLSEPTTEYLSGAFPGNVEPDGYIGDRIGPYEIIRKIGAGGMGAVYLAERVDEFQQRVALKLMKQEMKSGMAISRFRRERQILAGISHPNIARLLDGGATDDGRPYFVMEYVEGATIDSYCKRLVLPVRERLTLFRQVCAAVQYAHQNLVVHRDIKPTNILVTEGGTVKLLDFGIAKLLPQESRQETAALTSAGMRPMTPEYASPEQVRGFSITTSADVYSLGVVLYELLVGRLPYEFRMRSSSEIERVICEQEPRRPSTVAPAPLCSRLSGDLDVIVLKALEKDPQRRYPNVEQLSEDVRRHLEGVPITARPQTLKYRAGKFVRRNRTMVLAAVLVALALTGGLITTAWEGHIARRERDQAERRFREVRRLAESVLFEVHDKIKELTGATEARHTVVAKALESLDTLERDAGGDRGLQLELAEAYLRLGDVEGNPYSSDLGDTTGALASYDKALRLAQGAAEIEPRDARVTRTEALAWRQRSEVLPLIGKDQEAVASARKSVERFQALVEGFPADLNYRADLSISLEALGDVLGNPGLSELNDAEGAMNAYRKGLQVWTNILAQDPRNPGGPRAMAVLTMKLGDMELNVEHVGAARNLYSQALESIGTANLQNAENLRIAASVRRKLAYVTSYTDRAEALRQYRAAIGSREQLMHADPQNSRARIDLAVVLLESGELEESLSAMRPGAIESYRRALDTLSVLQPADPNNLRLQHMIADVRLRLGRLLAQEGDREQSARMSSGALEILRHLAERSGATSPQYSDYAEALLQVEPRVLRNPALALKYAQLASDTAHGLNPRYLDLIAEAHYQTGRPGQAIAIEQKALGLLSSQSAGRAQLERHLNQYRSASGR